MEPQVLECRPVESLAPYARNARTHSAEQVAQIAASIVEFGWTNPVLISGDGEIIAGHGRVEAAKLLGLADVPVIVLGHLSPAQRRAYVIADNKLALNAGWDDDVLAAELAALDIDGFDLSLVGFSDAEIKSILEPLTSPAADRENAGGGYVEKYSIIIPCESETHQAELYERFAADGLNPKVLVN